VLTFDHHLSSKNLNITRYLILQFFALIFLSGCSSIEAPQFLYPSDTEMRVRYLCSLPYQDATSPNKPWKKSIPDLLIVGQKKAIVYFNNDRSFVMSMDPKVNLPPGKYRCSL
tara:strand:+ start:565 stop:903 length:339 start_codon:yes stop_codon:yes gene_type:complete